MQLVYSKGRKRSAARGEPVSNLCIGPMAPLALCAARARSRTGDSGKTLTAHLSRPTLQLSVPVIAP